MLRIGSVYRTKYELSYDYLPNTYIIIGVSSEQYKLYVAVSLRHGRFVTFSSEFLLNRADLILE